MIAERKPEVHLLNEALTALTQRLGDAWGEVSSLQERRYPYDGEVSLRVGDVLVRLAVEVKEKASVTHVGRLLQWKLNANNFTLVSDYINPTLGALLREQAINYFDAAGNAYLRVQAPGGPVFVWLDGQKPTRVKEDLYADHAFTKAGLQVTFWLLTHPERVNDTVRTVAAETNVGLETVVRTKTSLKKQGYLMSLTPDTWGLTNRQKLLDKWVDAYTHRLKPRLLVGRYRPAKGVSLDDWASWPLDWPQTQWGGEPAADVLTGFLRPARLTLYSQQEKPELMRRLRLLPAEKETDAPVIVYRKFWTTEKEGQTAPPLVVYADLLEQGSARNAEVAQRLYEHHLSGLVGETPA